VFADYGIPGLPLFPDQASEKAFRVDVLFFFILGITSIVGLFVTILLVGFPALYVRRSERDLTPRISGFPLLEWSWTLGPIIPFAAFFGWGVALYSENLRPPTSDYEVFVVGKQWMWKIQHPGGQREINELHIPLGKYVKITLISEDVIHDFGNPAFRQKIDVLPNRYVSDWYHPTELGRFHLFCNQYCGPQHASMVGSIIVMRPDEHEQWLREHAEGSAALEGRKVFLKHQCISCHRADSSGHAPVLEGLYGRKVMLTDGRTVLADANYLRNSILYPARDVVEGWEPIMPTFQGQVSEEEIFQLIAYIQSLGRGDTPRPTSDFPPPVGAPGELPKDNPKKEAEKK
jgi:cytochrome c oxidase subunit 2